jgi:hypothetical protein
MGTMMGRRLVGVTAAIAALSLSFAASAAMAAERVEPDSVSVDGPLLPWGQGRSLTLVAATGLCVGEESPSLDTQVQELGPTATFPFYSAVITTSLLFPSRPLAGDVYCPDVGLSLESTIKLGHPTAQTFIYDGDQDPPRLLRSGVDVVPWRLVRVLGPRTIEIRTPPTGCVKRSTYAHVAERRGRAVITTYTRPVEGDERLGPFVPRLCLKFRAQWRKRLKLRQPIDRVKLFDGAYAPPRLQAASAIPRSASASAQLRGPFVKAPR